MFLCSGELQAEGGGQRSVGREFARLLLPASLCMARLWPAPSQGAVLNMYGHGLALLPMLPQIDADSRGQGWSCSPEEVNHNLPHRGVASSNDLSHIDGIGDDLQQHDD